MPADCRCIGCRIGALVEEECEAGEVSGYFIVERLSRLIADIIAAAPRRWRRELVADACRLIRDRSETGAHAHWMQ